MTISDLPSWAATGDCAPALAALGAGAAADRKRATVLLIAQSPRNLVAVFRQPTPASFRQWYGGRDHCGHFRRGWATDKRVQRAVHLARRSYLAQHNTQGG